jgi:hypothetical protein
MTLSVQERARELATFRFVAVYLMEALARWVPTTPEMEAKVLFGRHIWEMAQQADALGRRTYELRAPLHLSLRPCEEYMAVLAELPAAMGTGERIDGFYRAILPGLEARYRAYIEATDALMDAPSVRLLEDAVRGITRMCDESRATWAELGALPRPDPSWTRRLAEAEAGVRPILAPPPAEAAP